MSDPWGGLPHAIHEAARPDGDKISSPNFWYGEAWYLGFAFAGIVFVVAGGVAALAVWTGLGFLMKVAVAVAFMGFIPLFGGIASLLRRLIGGRALKRLVVAAVVLIILACATFLALVATRAPR